MDTVAQLRGLRHLTLAGVELVSSGPGGEAQRTDLSPLSRLCSLRSLHLRAGSGALRRE